VISATTGQKRCSYSCFTYLRPLAEECEAEGEARPPHKVVKISEFLWCCDKISSLEQGGR
jgi:hypothetical protein